MRNYPAIRDIREAQERLKPYIRRTPLLRAEKIEPAVGCELYLKPEILQITGAFKIRGALNKALSLRRDEIANGIIATSSGNHAQGIAYAARMLGVKAIIVVPVTTLRGHACAGEGCEAHCRARGIDRHRGLAGGRREGQAQREGLRRVEWRELEPVRPGRRVQGSRLGNAACDSENLEEGSGLLFDGVAVDLRRRRVVLDGHAGGIEDRDLFVIFPPGLLVQQDLADLRMDVALHDDLRVDGMLRFALFDALRDGVDDDLRAKSSTVPPA
jgi:hypothetical protein